MEIFVLKPRQLAITTQRLQLHSYQNVLPSAKSLHRGLACALVLSLSYIEVELFLERDASSITIFAN